MKNIISKYKFDIIEFDEVKKNYFNNPKIRIVYQNESVENIVLENKTSKTNDFSNIILNKLIEILEICISECIEKPNETIDIYSDLGNDSIIKVGFISKETNIEITIGLFRDFYILSRINYPNNIKFMPDEFWYNMLELSKLGKFKYIEENKPSQTIRKKHPDLFNKKGSIYKLFRNYFLKHIEYGKCSSLGNLLIEFERDMKTEFLIRNLIQSFQIIYNINKMLWSVERKKK